MKLTAIAYRFYAVICLLVFVGEDIPGELPAGSNQARIRKREANEMN
jgi:hypothetical protein